MLLVAKKLPAKAGDIKRFRFNPWVGKIPWNRKWQPTPVFLLGKSNGQRSLVGYSPQGCKKSDTIELTHTHTHTHSDKIGNIPLYSSEQILER